MPGSFWNLSQWASAGGFIHPDLHKVFKWRPRLSTSKVEKADAENGEKGTRVLIALKLPSTPGVFYLANSQIFLWVSFIIITDLSAAFDMTHFLSSPNLWLQWLFSVLGLSLSQLSLPPFTFSSHHLNMGHQIWSPYWTALGTPFIYLFYLFILLFGCTLRHVGS